MKFVADAADIVRGAKNFTWCNFAQHDNFACHVDQKQAILHHMAQLFVMWSNLIMWSKDKLLQICNLGQFVITLHENFTPHDECTIYAALL